MDNLVVKETLTKFVNHNKEETYSRFDTELSFMETEIKQLERYMDATFETVSEIHGSDYVSHFRKELRFLKQTCDQLVDLVETFKQLEEVQEAINNL